MDRCHEAQIVDAIVGQYRSRCRVDEQSGRKGNDQIAVGHPPVEEGIGACCFLVHVSVEDVTGELGKMLDVLQGDDPLAGDELVTDPQAGQRLPERMAHLLPCRRTGQPAPG